MSREEIEKLVLTEVMNQTYLPREDVKLASDLVEDLDLSELDRIFIVGNLQVGITVDEWEAWKTVADIVECVASKSNAAKAGAK